MLLSSLQRLALHHLLLRAIKESFTARHLVPYTEEAGNGSHPPAQGLKIYRHATFPQDAPFLRDPADHSLALRSGVILKLRPIMVVMPYAYLAQGVRAPFWGANRD